MFSDRAGKRSAGNARSFFGTGPMQQQQQQHSQDILASFLAAGAAAECFGSSVDSILQTLEDQQSLLTGMFKDFLQEHAAAASGPQLRMRPTPTIPQQPRHSEHEQRHHGLKRSRATERPLTLTLEELFCGAVKRIPVEVRRQDARTGAPINVMQQLQVCVQPGLHAGTRITFPGLGNLDTQGQQSDLTFIVQQQLHPAFRRLADDLYAIVDIPLVTALTGGPVELKTLNGQLLQLPLADNTIITPNSELLVKNQGMPVFGDTTGKRGALHVRFRVCFPSQLSPQQQHMLRQALSGGGDEYQQQLQAGSSMLAAAAGLLPKPTAGLPLLPPCSGAGPTAQRQQQQQQDSPQSCSTREHFRLPQLWKSWPAAAGSSQQAAACATAGVPGSSNSTWAAAGPAGGGGCGAVSAFAKAAAGLAGPGACSVASSSSVTGLAACMQSTGSSREPAAGSSRTALQ